MWRAGWNKSQAPWKICFLIFWFLLLMNKKFAEGKVEEVRGGRQISPDDSWRQRGWTCCRKSFVGKDRTKRFVILFFSQLMNVPTSCFYQRACPARIARERSGTGRCSTWDHSSWICNRLYILAIESLCRCVVREDKHKLAEAYRVCSFSDFAYRIEESFCFRYIGWCVRHCVWPWKAFNSFVALDERASHVSHFSAAMIKRKENGKIFCSVFIVPQLNQDFSRTTAGRCDYP